MPGTALVLCPTLPHPKSPPFWSDNTRQPYRDRKKGPRRGEGSHQRWGTDEGGRGAGDQQGGLAVAAQEEEAVSTGDKEEA